MKKQLATEQNKIIKERIGTGGNCEV